MLKRLNFFWAASICAGSLFAQSSQLSLGADVAIPLRKFNNRLTLGRGPAVGFELPLGERFGLTIHGAYDFLVINDPVHGRNTRSVLIPAQAGLKYYFQGQQKGFYGHGQLGIHISMQRLPDPFYNFNSIDPTWAIGVGYQLERFDFGVRYNSLLNWKSNGGGGTGYLGLRVAYLIPLN